VNGTLLRALLVAVPDLMLLVGSAAAWRRNRSASAFLVLVGTACLMVMILTHICEALRLFPAMGWGREHTPGHYLDQASAIAGLTFFLAGCVLTFKKGSDS
jgi:succinate dehydrogenase/fumarate reductase cytochrome b subunit